MARIRTIKPEFFLDDELAELPVIARLLFIGLWTLADCEGRLEDRPKKIRAQILPFDDNATDDLLQDLHNHGFIQRYQVDGKNYLLITNFKKHQRLTGKEAEMESICPAPSLDYLENNQGKQLVSDGETTGKQLVSDGETTGKQLVSDGETTGKQLVSDGEILESQEGKGKEGKGRERKGNGEAEKISPPEKQKHPPPSKKTSIPPDFEISDGIRLWAQKNNHTQLDEHFESFRDKALAKNYQYADWDAALKTAIREDWAKLKIPPSHAPPKINWGNGGGYKTKTDIINERNAETLRLVNQQIEDQQRVVN